jgi:superfamily II DNA/RNA helicase
VGVWGWVDLEVDGGCPSLTTDDSKIHLTYISNRQVEPPKDPETYIHRSGRTGRAGHTGVCITLVGRKHEGHIPYIEKKAGFKFE